ncbi:MAG: twin-arginine translocase TatA/TatE family subunit [Alphaproteobacteria bacterium]|nr:twin-arginine translocase TatA/TatE family subunit [Alphaproteobacteria bacterium]
MLDFSWAEIFVVGTVALVVIGPKDMPKVMHKFGVWMGKARRAFWDFQQNMEQLAHEAELYEQDEKPPDQDKPHE